MNIFGIVRSAAQYVVNRYANDDLKQPNLSIRGNIITEQVLVADPAGDASAVNAVADIDDGLIAVGQTLPLVITENYVYEVSSDSWRRARALPDNADAVAVSGLGVPVTVPHPYVFNGVTWDRTRSIPDNADAQAAIVTGALGIVARLQAANASNNWDRVRCNGNQTDALITQSAGAINVNAVLRIYNGASLDRARSASASVQANFALHVGIAAVAMVGNWSIHHDPAAATQATITRAAGAAGIRHICTSISATFSAGATAGAATKVYLRDGATGVGTILWSGSLAAPIGDSRNILLSGLSIVGSAATDMTLEFAAAGALTTLQNVSLTGYTTA